MTLIEAIKQNKQKEFFEILNIKTDLSGKRIIDEIDPEHGGNPLHVATAYGHLHFIVPLIEAGIDVDQPDNDGWTAVYIAADKGYAEIITALKGADADVNKPNSDGVPPIYIATENEHVAAISALGAAGAKMDVPDNDGLTSLCIAIEMGDARTIIALLEAGASARVKTPKGTPLEQAKEQAARNKESGCQEVVRVLEAHLKQYPKGIKAQTATNKKTALHNNSEVEAKAGRDVITVAGSVRGPRAISISGGNDSSAFGASSSGSGSDLKEVAEANSIAVLEQLKLFFMSEEYDGSESQHCELYNSVLKVHKAILVYSKKEKVHRLFVNDECLGAQNSIKIITQMIESLPSLNAQSVNAAPNVSSATTTQGNTRVQAHAGRDATTITGGITTAKTLKEELPQSPVPQPAGYQLTSQISPSVMPAYANNLSPSLSALSLQSNPASTVSPAPQLVVHLSSLAAALVPKPNVPEQKNPPETAMLTQFKEVAKPSPTVNVSDKELQEFLRLVAEGEQDKAEASLKSNPNLALVPGDVTDLSKRTFKGITAFQYSVWALDWHMWTMIRKYLPDEAAREQARGFETGAWVRQHGVHAQRLLDNLIQAYQTVNDLYEVASAAWVSKASKYAKSNTAFVQQLGGAQRLLPAHVINEYCHPTRSFYHLPNFKDAAALPRSRTLNKGEWFTAGGGKLGEAFAYCRSNEKQVKGFDAGCGAWVVRVGHLGARSDHDSIRALTRTRTAQREELIIELKPSNHSVYKVSGSDLKEFLRLIAEGEQDKAEAMLRSNPNLALVPADVTDLSKRTFSNITGFQYAVWALDWHMWTMIRKYLSDDAAREQAQGFETGAWVKTHGVHANLNNLIQAYETTLTLYNQSKNKEGDKAWVRQVGGAQLLLPAHVINEYCHPTRPLVPTPNFKDGAALPRTRTVEIGSWFPATNGLSPSVLGETIAFYRGPYSQTNGWSSEGSPWRNWVGADHKSVSELTISRTAQREELIIELRPRSTQRKVA